LSFAIAARFLHLYKVNANFAFVTSNWFMIALLVLTIADFVVDKFPVIDHTWDAVHTAIRPIMGALVAAASYSQFHIPGTNTSTAHSLMPQVLATSGSSVHMLDMVVAAGSSLPAISA